MQRDNNLVLYRKTTDQARPWEPVWSSSTRHKGPILALMQDDGNFVLYDNRLGANGKGAVWATGTNPNSGAFIALQNDGNLVIYKGSSAIWQTGSH